MLSREGGGYRRFRPVACNIVAAASFIWFSYETVTKGWSQITTDFPNYYTAARLAVAGTPLRDFYDYPQFQREIGRAGMDQLGGYTPQTPLTMAPLIPLSTLAPLPAKRVWLALNLAFLGLSLCLLTQITRFNLCQVWLLTFLSYGALRQNFVLGQYYVLLLAILTLAAYCLLRSLDRAAGWALAAALVLKLYGAPFVFFLAAKRRSRTTLTIVVLALLSVASAVAMFGFDGMTFYASQVLPRSLAGETLNPYHVSNNTFVTLLRRLFIAEPGLNPHPLLRSPAAFAFTRCAFTLAVLLQPVLAAWQHPGPATRSELAWWSIALLLVSPNTASYTFVLLLLPIVLLLDEPPGKKWPLILAPYIVLALPLRPAWETLFPKAWLLLFLFVLTGWRSIGSIDRRTQAWAAAVVVSIASLAAVLAAKFPESPTPFAIPIAVQPDEIYANSPAVSSSGIFFETLAYGPGAPERYVVRNWDGIRFETFMTEGHAFHPSVPDSGDKVYFELFSGARSSIAFYDLPAHRFGTIAACQRDPHDPAISHDGSKLAFVSHGGLYVSGGGSCRDLQTQANARNPSFVPGDRELVYASESQRHWRILQVDLATGEDTVLVDNGTELASPSISHDRSRLLYASRRTGSWQIWIKNLAGNRDVQMTSGSCNSQSPAWTLDSAAIVFASDCNRGLNLPALLRLPVTARLGKH